MSEARITIKDLATGGLDVSLQADGEGRSARIAADLVAMIQKWSTSEHVVDDAVRAERQRLADLIDGYAEAGTDLSLRDVAGLVLGRWGPQTGGHYGSASTRIRRFGPTPEFSTKPPMVFVELDGEALNLAVAKALGLEIGGAGTGDNFPNYIASWGQAGPIIEREKMCVVSHVDGTEGQQWEAIIDRVPLPMIRGFGATPLVAAMRCFVALKYR